MYVLFIYIYIYIYIYIILFYIIFLYYIILYYIIHDIVSNTRIKKNMSEKNALDGHVENLKECFFSRRYPDNLVKKQVERAIRSTLSDERNK